MYTKAKGKKGDEYFWKVGFIFGNKNLEPPSPSLPKPQVDSSLIQI